MSLDGSYRKCRVTLGPEDLGSARPLRFPAGCRRALPILNATAGSAFENGLIPVSSAGMVSRSWPSSPQEAEHEGLVARTSTGGLVLGLPSEDTKGFIDEAGRPLHLGGRADRTLTELRIETRGSP